MPYHKMVQRETATRNRLFDEDARFRSGSGATQSDALPRRTDEWRRKMARSAHDDWPLRGHKLNCSNRRRRSAQPSGDRRVDHRSHVTQPHRPRLFSMDLPTLRSGLGVVTAAKPHRTSPRPSALDHLTDSQGRRIRSDHSLRATHCQYLLPSAPRQGSHHPHR